MGAPKSPGVFERLVAAVSGSYQHIENEPTTALYNKGGNAQDIADNAVHGTTPPVAQHLAQEDDARSRQHADKHNVAPSATPDAITVTTNANGVKRYWHP